MKNLKINSIEPFEDICELMAINNACCSYDDLFLNGFQVDINLTVNNSLNETRIFNISLQSQDRNNGMMYYSKFSMVTSSQYGNDFDESEDLVDWLKETDQEDFAGEIIDHCIDIADKKAEDKYEEMMDEQ